MTLRLVTIGGDLLDGLGGTVKHGVILGADDPAAIMPCAALLGFEVCVVTISEMNAMRSIARRARAALVIEDNERRARQAESAAGALVLEGRWPELIEELRAIDALANALAGPAADTLPADPTKEGLSHARSNH